MNDRTCEYIYRTRMLVKMDDGPEQDAEFAALDRLWNEMTEDERAYIVGTSSQAERC